MPKVAQSSPHKSLSVALSGLALAAAASVGAATGQLAGPHDAIPAPGAPGETQTAMHLDLRTFEREGQADDTPDTTLPGPPRDDAALVPPPMAPPAALPASPRIEEQTFRYDSLINGSAERRGAVVSWHPGTQTLLKGFQVAPARGNDPVEGPDQDRGDDRLQGMLVEHRWGFGDRAELQLNGGWLAGGAATAVAAGDTAGRAGSAWALGGRAALLARRLKLSFEYAGSRLQAPGAGALPDRAGAAYRAGAELASPPGDGTGWRLGAQYRWIGPRFSSVANPTLSRDRLRLSTFAGIQRDDWRIDLRVDQDRSNLRRDPAAATRRGERAELATSWEPEIPDIGQLLGRPRITLAADVERSQLFPASAPASAPQLREGRRIRLESAFDTGDWLWGVKASGGATTARGSDGPTGSDTARVRLYGDPAADAALPLKPALTWVRRRDAATAAVDRDWGAELHSGPIALGSGLRADLEVGYLQRRQADDGDRQDALEIGGSLVWTLQRPAAGRRGLALAVTGSARGGDGLAGADGQGDYRLMLSLSSGNPLAGW